MEYLKQKIDNFTQFILSICSEDKKQLIDKYSNKSNTEILMFIIFLTK